MFERGRRSKQSDSAKSCTDTVHVFNFVLTKEFFLIIPPDLKNISDNTN